MQKRDGAAVERLKRERRDAGKKKKDQETYFVRMATLIGRWRTGANECVRDANGSQKAKGKSKIKGQVGGLGGGGGL